MNKRLEILKQYNLKEIIYLILIWCFGKTIREKQKNLLELKCLLEEMNQNNYKARRVGKNNVLTIFNDPDIYNYKINLRRTTSDIPAFRMIFLDKEYKRMIDKISLTVGNENIKYIIDAGANIGCSTVYFKKSFTNSTIISIEPEQSNYKCLLENIKINGLQNVIPINGGLWVSDCYLEIDNNFRDKREWAFTVKEASDLSTSHVKGMTINGIMAKYSIPYIDILKIDIEGTEKFIFENEERARSFLPLVRYLTMEIHEEFISKDHIIVLLKKFGFSYFFNGELIVAYQQKFGAVNPS